MEFHIKNMVCDRCIMVVQNDFDNASIAIDSIALGKVSTVNKLVETAKIQQLKQQLELHGFELLETEEAILSDAIKTEILNFVAQADMESDKLSVYLTHKLHKDYGVLSKHFSKYNDSTIERYLIKLKVEKAKQYIREGRFNFSEIAAQLGYHSLSHLSTQFKKETGVSLSEFKSNPDLQRNTLDKIL